MTDFVVSGFSQEARLQLAFCVAGKWVPWAAGISAGAAAAAWLFTGAMRASLSSSREALVARCSSTTCSQSLGFTIINVTYCL